MYIYITLSLYGYSTMELAPKTEPIKRNSIRETLLSILILMQKQLEKPQ